MQLGGRRHARHLRASDGSASPSPPRRDLSRRLLQRFGSERVAFDKATQRLFVANSRTQSIDVISLSGEIINPDRPSRLIGQFSINVAALLPVIPVNAGVVQSIGAATPTSIVVQNGLLAVVLQHGQEPTRRGKVAFYRAAGGPSDLPLKVIDVGFMPAEATFAPNGLRLLVANEGEPTQDYRTDPLGSVSIIDLAGGVANARATQVDFSAWNSRKADLVRRGVRITGPNLATADPRDTASVARDFEPTDTTIRADSKVAWVTLAENNAVAVLNIPQAKFTAIQPLGYKDHSRPGAGLDPTDNDDARATGAFPKGVNIEPWPLRGLYMPRRLALGSRLGAAAILVYPNEGIRRNFSAFSDEIRLDDPGLKIDPAAFPAATIARLKTLRLKVSRVDGDKNGDGIWDNLYSLGGRSFAVRDLQNRILFDSGDDFERITAEATKQTFGRLASGQPYFAFNAADDENSFDENSDLRGPEPISIATGRVGDRTYAFIGLERVGGVMTYDITDPAAASFKHYINNRNFALDPKAECIKGGPEIGRCAGVGDLSVEDLLFVPARDSPLAKPLVIASNATSGSATVYVLDGAGG